LTVRRDQRGLAMLAVPPAEEADETAKHQGAGAYSPRLPRVCVERCSLPLLHPMEERVGERRKPPSPNPARNSRGEGGKYRGRSKQERTAQKGRGQAEQDLQDFSWQGPRA